MSVGRFSHSLYLVHAPLLQIVWQFLIRPMHLRGPAALGLLALVGLPLILAAAYGFYRCFELPFIRMRPAVPAPEYVH